MIDQKAGAGAALPVDEYHAGAAEVGEAADVFRIALREEQTLGAGHEVNQFLPGQKPFRVLRECLLTQLAFRDVEAAEIAGTSRH